MNHFLPYFAIAVTVLIRRGLRRFVRRFTEPFRKIEVAAAEPGTVAQLWSTKVIA